MRSAREPGWWVIWQERSDRPHINGRLAFRALPSRKTRTTPALPVAAGWSSPVARQAHNLKVAGSNPAPATKFHIANVLRRLLTPQMGQESLVFRSRLKTGTASHEHFLFSEGRFSPDLRTWACQSLGHNPLISHRSIRAGFISGSEYWPALQTTGFESLRACQTRFLSLFYLSVLLTLLT